MYHRPILARFHTLHTIFRTWKAAKTRFTKQSWSWRPTQTSSHRSEIFTSVWWRTNMSTSTKNVRMVSPHLSPKRMTRNMIWRYRSCAQRILSGWLGTGKGWYDLQPTTLFSVLNWTQILQLLHSQSTSKMEELTNQMIKMGKSSQKEATSMRIITIVTLVYLPGTFVSVSHSCSNSLEFVCTNDSEDSFQYRYRQIQWPRRFRYRPEHRIVFFCGPSSLATSHDSFNGRDSACWVGRFCNVE